MRTDTFTFKKTVKRTKTFRGLSVDLTVAEAKWLLDIIDYGTDEPIEVDAGTDPEGEFLSGLSIALQDFIDAGDGESP